MPILRVALKTVLDQDQTTLPHRHAMDS